MSVAVPTVLTIVEKNFVQYSRDGVTIFSHCRSRGSGARQGAGRRSLVCASLPKKGGGSSGDGVKQAPAAA